MGMSGLEGVRDSLNNAQHGLRHKALVGPWVPAGDARMKGCSTLALHFLQLICLCQTSHPMKEHGIFACGARVSTRENTVLKFKIPSRVFNQAHMECDFLNPNGRMNGFEHSLYRMNLFPRCLPEVTSLVRVRAARGFQYFTHFIMRLALGRVHTPYQCGFMVPISPCSQSIL